MKNGRGRSVARLAFALAALFAVRPPGASAQAAGEYYRELRVDGRIRVFSTEQGYAAYRQSRGIGLSITRRGYGPAGETVVFEGATAVEAFDRRHGGTGAPSGEDTEPEDKAPFAVEYRKPGLRLSFPGAEINLAGRLQVRYTHETFDDVRSPPDPLPTSLEDRGSFRIRRMRIKLDGWLYTKSLTYEVQWDLADTSGNELLDASVDYDFTGGRKLLRLRAGQFKAPFNYQQLASTGSLQLIDRSILDAFFVPGRQVGAQLWGQVGREGVADLVDWRVGIFNGNGRSTTANDNDEFEYVARVMVSPWGSVGFAESNFEAYDFRLSFAGEYDNNDTIVRPATGARTGADVETFGAAAVLKAFKSLFLYGQYHHGESESPAGIETERDGWLVQGGWLLTPKWEIAGRWARIDPNTDGDDDERSEWRVGVSWYIHKHNWKLQSDYGVTRNEAAAATTNRELKELRVQAQIVF